MANKSFKFLVAAMMALAPICAEAQTANNPTVITGVDSTGFPIYTPVGTGTGTGPALSTPMPVTISSGGPGSTVTANQGTAASVAGGWPVIAGEPADTTGTFTNATQATAITTPSVDGYETATITINGTYNTATATFLASDDGGTTYYALSCARTDSPVVESGYTALTNTNRAWFCPIHSFDVIRVQSSAVTSGTVNVRISISSFATSAGSAVSISSNSTVGVEGLDGSTQASAANPFPVIKSAGSTFAPAQVALNSSTSTQILATLTTPHGRNVCNLDTAINEFIGPTGVTTSTGIKLLPGSCWDATNTTAAIFGISASATPSAAGVQY